jgi:hypothetical protein
LRGLEAVSLIENKKSCFVGLLAGAGLLTQVAAVLRVQRVKVLLIGDNGKGQVYELASCSTAGDFHGLACSA